MRTLAQIKSDLKTILPNGIDVAISAIKALLFPGTDTFNALILLESRYRETNQSLLLGVLSNENASLEFNKIRQAILTFIDDLKAQDLTSTAPESEQTLPDQYNGEVFYRIPDQMQVETEVKCLVRVAYDKAILLEGLETIPADVVKDIRISEVMGVELLDPGANPRFEIRSFNETVQFIEKDLFTEWVFYVKPLKTGTFPLLLKIAVIEIREGKERKREVVMEELVEITSSSPPDAAKESPLLPAGIQFSAAGLGAVAAREASTTPKADDTTSPQVGTGGGGTPVRKIATALGMVALLVTVSVALYTFLPRFFSEQEVLPTPTVDGWRDYLKNNPGGKYREAAQSKLDSAETALWEQALASNDTLQIIEYLRLFPEGRYVHIAREMRTRVNVPVQEQLFMESVLYRDTLWVICRGGKQPYEVIFSQSGKTILQRPLGDRDTLSVPTGKLQPGDYALLLQDAQGSVFLDTITVERKVENKPAVQKPVSARKKTGTQGPAKGQKPAPSQSPVSGGNQPPPQQTAPVAPPSERKPDPVSAVVPMKNAFRLPAFLGCDREKQDKEFRCTNQKIARYLGERMQYPEEALRKHVQGKVIVEFIVETDGSVSQAIAIQKLGAGCDEEAVRLVNQLPHFRPGRGRDGRAIRVKYQLPVVFKIAD